MITIIDAPCGAGKTTWAIQEINQNADKGYIYCTPYLDEITRIKDSTAIGRLKEPEYYINNGENFSCCAKIINIISDQSYKRSNSLSKKWYKSMTSEQANALKGKIRYHLTKRMEAKAPDIMWTCPKDYRPKLTGKGYTEIRRLTSEEKKLPDKERKQLESELSCFVSCNARATNKYTGLFSCHGIAEAKR